MAKLAILIGWASYYALVNNAITTLYPLKAAELEISESWIGQVLGIYSIASFIFLPISLWMLQRCSDLAVFQIGLTLLSLTLALVALLPQIQEASLFLAISFLFRIVEGSADMMINMSIMNIVQKAENKDVYLNLMVGFFSIGGALGPFLVSMLITPFGFSGLYLSLSCVIIASALVCRLLQRVFNDSNKTQELLDSLSHEETAASLTDRFTLAVVEEEIIDPSFTQILKIKRVLIALIFFVVVASLWTFRDPILPIYLKSQGVQDANIGFYYLTQTLANAICGLIPLLFVNCVSPKSLIVTGSIGIAMSLFLIGPSSILKLGHSLVTLQIGLGFLGATFNFACSPVISDMMEGIKEVYPQTSNPERLSMLYLAARALGYWMGPFLGSILYTQFHFSLTCDIFAIFCVFMICLYSDLFSTIPWLFRRCSRQRVLHDEYHQLNGGPNLHI